MYTRGKARRNASASANETEEEYIDAPEIEPPNMISGSQSQYDWFPRSVATSGTKSQTFEVATTESRCEETDNTLVASNSPFTRRSRHSSRNSSSSQHQRLGNDRDVGNTRGDRTIGDKIISDSPHRFSKFYEIIHGLHKFNYEVYAVSDGYHCTNDEESNEYASYRTKESL
jgi:hypothetical protein